jgi:hypothetical protein
MGARRTTHPVTDLLRLTLPLLQSQFRHGAPFAAQRNAVKRALAAVVWSGNSATVDVRRTAARGAGG